MATLGAVKINEGKVLRLWFEVDQFREPTQITPDTSAPYTEDDKEGQRFTTASSGEQLTLVPIVTYSLNDDPISFAYSSDNPTEIDVAPDGQIAFMVAPESTASAIITIVSTSGTATTTRTVSVTLTLSGAASVDVIEGGVAGSARKALSDPMDDALIVANPATQQKVYTTQDPYVRNTSFFLQGTHAEALTCTSPWNSRQAGNRAGTAITARHAVLANHYPLIAGDTLRFIASDNTVITRTVVQAARISSNGEGTDAWMILFDSDLSQHQSHRVRYSQTATRHIYPLGQQLPQPQHFRCWQWTLAKTALPLILLQRHKTPHQRWLTALQQYRTA